MEQKLKWGSVYRDNRSGQIHKYFCPHAGQQEILNQQSAKILLALGGVNSAKTSCGCLWMAQEVIRHHGKGDFLIVAPQWGVVLSSTYKRWLEVANGWAPLSGKWHPHQSNPRYELDAGGTIYFRSADGNFNGLKPQAILLDEGGDIKEEQFHDIKGRMTTGGRLLIATTPYPKYDWIRYEIMEQADKGNPHYFYKCFDSSLNPTTDPAHLEEERKRLQPWEFDMRYRGIFSSPPNQVYDFTSCWVDTPNPQGDILAFPAGVDFGGNDPTVILAGMLDEADTLWIWWEYYADENQDIQKFLDDAKGFHEHFKKRCVGRSMTWYCDHRPEIIRALRQNNIDARKANKKKVGRTDSIEVGISLVQARIRTGRLKIVRSQCPHLKEEGTKYRYAMQDGVAVGAVPIDKWNHCCDALRYLVMGTDRQTAKPRVGV